VALVNHRSREIHFKIVYYGPGSGGKTTNLRILHSHLPADRRGRLLAIANEQERTLFFDFLPVDLGRIQGYSTRVHLYTVPGQVYYKLSRRVVLQGVDGVVFVADSHPARASANFDSREDLIFQLEEIGLTPEERAKLPWVFQYNKRDLPGVMPIERMRAALNTAGAPDFEAVAVDGRGVSETLKAACKSVLNSFTRVVGAAIAPAPSPPVAAPPLPPMPPSVAARSTGLRRAWRSRASRASRAS
jgi:signal recognition particle receptor subunit beta